MPKIVLIDGPFDGEVLEHASPLPPSIQLAKETDDMMGDPANWIPQTKIVQYYAVRVNFVHDGFNVYTRLHFYVWDRNA